MSDQDSGGIQPELQFKVSNIQVQFCETQSVVGASGSVGSVFASLKSCEYCLAVLLTLEQSITHHNFSFVVWRTILGKKWDFLYSLKWKSSASPILTLILHLVISDLGKVINTVELS